jgi:hypothetical protein
MIDRYDLFGRRMEDTEPDMLARFVRFDQHNERIAQLEARVAALTKFAEFCDYHHRSCTGLQGQHLECDCGYSDARDELRDALAQAEKTKEGT